MEPVIVDLECPICRDVYIEPKLLSCLHTVCLACVNDSIRMATEDGRVSSCPLCREPTILPPQGAASLPTNLLVARRIRQQARGHPFHSDATFSSTSGGPVCKVCTEEEMEIPAEACLRCVECSKDLCEAHGALHQRRRDTRQHVLNPVIASSPTLTLPSQSNCLEHTEEAVFALCDTCQKLVCKTCVLSNHNTHLLLGLAEASGKYSQSLAADAETVRSRLPELERAMQDLDQITRALRQREAALLADVEENFDILFGQLKNRRETLMREVRTSVQADIKTLELQRSELTILHDVCVIGCRLTEGIVSEASAFSQLQPAQHLDLLRLRGLVSGRLADLRTKQPLLTPLIEDTLRFDFPRDKPWGSPITSLGHFYRVPMPQPRSVGRRDYVSILEPVAVFGSQGTGPGQFNNVAGVAVTASGLLVASDSTNCRLQLLGPDGRSVRVLSGEGMLPAQMRYPHCVAVAADGHLWVADYGNHRVQCLTEEGTFVRQITVRNPVGVAVLPNGDVAITDGLFSHSVYVYSSEGTLRRSFGGKGSAPGRFDAAWGVAVTAAEELVVADGNNHRVQVFTAEGHFLRQIGGSGLMNRPGGVTISPDGLLLVTELDAHRVSAWTLDGQRVHAWGSRGSGVGQFFNPFGVCVLPNGRIAVADKDNHRIQLF